MQVEVGANACTGCASSRACYYCSTIISAQQVSSTKEQPTSYLPNTLQEDRVGRRGSRAVAAPKQKGSKDGHPEPFQEVVKARPCTSSGDGSSSKVQN